MTRVSAADEIATIGYSKVILIDAGFCCTAAKLTQCKGMFDSFSAPPTSMLRARKFFKFEMPFAKPLMLRRFAA
jgi:hypothetical protein